MKQRLGPLHLTLFTVCAITTLDTLTAVAAIGPSALFWWPVILVGFVLPYGLVTSELATAWPEDGGISHWIRRAFGQSWGVRACYIYWLSNSPLWMSSLYILSAGVLVSLVFPGGGHWLVALISIIMIWLTVMTTNRRLHICKWVPSLGSVIKVVIVISMALLSWKIYQNSGSANELSLQSIFPFPDTLNSSVKFLPAMVFNLLGFELMSGLSRDTANPQRDLPIAIFWSAIIISLFYLMGSLAMLVAIPASEVKLTGGMVELFQILLGGNPLAITLLYIIMSLVILTLLADGVSWSLGACRMARAAAEKGEFPALLAHSNGNNAPVGATVFSGCLATIIVVTYALITTSSDELFWEVFSFSVLFMLMPYIPMFLAFLKLRSSAAHHPRPFRVAGPHWLLYLISGLGIAFVLWAMSILLMPNGKLSDLLRPAGIMTLSGSAVMILVIESLLRSQLQPRTIP